jgi:hypothetical protein
MMKITLTLPILIALMSGCAPRHAVDIPIDIAERLPPEIALKFLKRTHANVRTDEGKLKPFGRSCIFTDDYTFRFEFSDPEMFGPDLYHRIGPFNIKGSSFAAFEGNNPNPDFDGIIHQITLVSQSGRLCNIHVRGSGAKETQKWAKKAATALTSLGARQNTK